MFDLQPTLRGQLILLRPLQPDDWDGLYAVASDPLIWEQHPARDRYRPDVFRIFFDEALASRGAFAAIDAASGQIIGSSRFSGYDSATSQIEIGWTFLGRSYWGGRYNGEMKRLMIDHALKSVERVVFCVGTTNTRSQKAIEKFGALRDGIVPRTMGGLPVPHIRYVIRRPVTT